MEHSYCRAKRLSTTTPTARTSHIPLQQAVFHALLTGAICIDFFRAIGVDPEDDDAEPTELRPRIGPLGCRHRPGAARLERLATEPSLEAYSIALLAETRALLGRAPCPGNVRKSRIVNPIVSTDSAAEVDAARDRDERMPLSVLVEGPAGPLQLEGGGSWLGRCRSPLKQRPACCTTAWSC